MPDPLKPTPIISCLTKQRYESREQCRGALRQAHRRRAPVEPYRCGHCRGWHIGTRTAKDRIDQIRTTSQEKKRKRLERCKYTVDEGDAEE